MGIHSNLNIDYDKKEIIEADYYSKLCNFIFTKLKDLIIRIEIENNY